MMGSVFADKYNYSLATKNDEGHSEIGGDFYKRQWNPSTHPFLTLEVEAPKYLLYCERSPSFATPVISLFFRPMDGLCWGLMTLSCILLFLRKCQLNGLVSLPILFLRQPVPGKSVTGLVVLTSLACIVLSGGYEAFLSSFMSVPLEHQRVSGIKELLIGKGFKIYEPTEQGQKDLFPILQIKLKKGNTNPLLTKKMNLFYNKAVINASAETFPDQLTTIISIVDVAKKLFDLGVKKEELGIKSCNVVSESLYSDWVFWMVRNHNSDQMHRTVQLIINNGILQEYVSLFYFRVGRYNRWLKSRQRPRMGLTSNLQVAFQLYLLCIAVCLVVLGFEKLKRRIWTINTFLKS
jgi:hypothetical protein